MIKAIIFVAATLLILQIGLTVAVHKQQAVNLESTAPDSAFLAFTPDSITSVLINGPENEDLVLQKSDKGWIMPGAFSAPASKHQVDDLLQKLADARQGLAVATSKGAAKRFKTAKEDFERHILLKQDDTVAANFYLGTSAGLRNSHVRKADQDAVVSISVGSHEVDVDADSWLDRTLADLSKDDLKAVALGDISLSKKEEGKEKGQGKIWLLDGVTKEKIEKEAVDKLLNKVTAISVQSVLDPSTSAELFTKDPVVQFTVTKQDDSKVTYAFAEKDDYFVLKMSGNDLYFKVGKWLVEDLTEAKREKLLVGYEEKKEEVPVVQPVAQQAPQVDVPEQQAEQAVLPELPPEEEEAPSVQMEVQGQMPGQEEAEDLKDEQPVQNSIQNTVQNTEPAEQDQQVQQVKIEVKPAAEAQAVSVSEKPMKESAENSASSAEDVNKEDEKVAEPQ
ncbi:MAG: DUF4340 domain-containing protein [Candidatus Electrothrix sp. GM3_4]|nr:DUF4340 domain-containing protein [Candidatus Electrothrix sp. GM3_4]